MSIVHKKIHGQWLHSFYSSLLKWLHTIHSSLLTKYAFYMQSACKTMVNHVSMKQNKYFITIMYNSNEDYSYKHFKRAGFIYHSTIKMKMAGVGWGCLHDELITEAKVFLCVVWFLIFVALHPSRKHYLIYVLGYGCCSRILLTPS